MELYQIDDEGRLFMSADLRDWSHAVPHGIDVVIDVDGGLDACIPTHSNHCLYIYFPFEDDDQTLPNVKKLHAIADLAASLIREGHRVRVYLTADLDLPPYPEQALATPAVSNQER